MAAIPDYPGRSGRKVRLIVMSLRAAWRGTRTRVDRRVGLVTPVETAMPISGNGAEVCNRAPANISTATPSAITSGTGCGWAAKRADGVAGHPPCLVAVWWWGLSAPAILGGASGGKLTVFTGCRVLPDAHVLADSNRAFRTDPNGSVTAVVIAADALRGYPGILVGDCV